MKKSPALKVQLSSYLKFFILLFGVLVFAVSCNEDDPIPIEPEPIENESVTLQFSSDGDGGVISLDQSSMIVPPYSIPNLSSGSPATVTFTIEDGAELPKSLPSGMEAVGAVTHFGPEGFVFQEPLWLQFNLPNDVAVDQVSIVGYLPDTRDYGVLPITYYDEEARIIGTSVYELGYYFLANIEGLNRSRAYQSAGGFRINSSNGNGWYSGAVTGWSSTDTYYKIIITNFVPDNPDHYALWAPYDPNANNGRRYWEFGTPPKTTGWKPNHWIGITTMSLPQGVYTAQIMASHKYLQSDWPECKVYSMETTFTISGSINCTFASCTGYDEGPRLPAGGSWDDAVCGVYKPIHTEPVCTGDFQATLTWHNGTAGDTDLDLHLEGPDGLHVAWTNKNPGIGGIILDRDIISDPGPVQENICAPALADMPRGDYKISVDHYSGADKSYQVRVLIGSNSTSFQGDLNSGDEDDLVHTFTLN